jgi:hypothetical protein
MKVGRLENKGLAIGGGSKNVQHLVCISSIPPPPPPIINDRSLEQKACNFNDAKHVIFSKATRCNNSFKDVEFLLNR